MSSYRLGFALVATIMVAGACDDPTALPLPWLDNSVDTLTLSALRGTPVTDPSGFYLVLKMVARTDRSNETFDFAADIDESGQAEIFPTGALGLSALSAVLKAEVSFEEIKDAPVDGFVADSSLILGVNDVFVVRSQAVPDNCPPYIGALPRYGKFRVLSIDLTSRNITFEYLVNVNCGYRSLEPGTPVD